MAQIIALAAKSRQHLTHGELPRAMIVLGCAMALILAGNPLPI